MKKTAYVLLITILLSSCLPRNMQVPQSEFLPFLERKSGLIAYIGVDWNIYTSDQAGKKLTAYTDDALLPESATDAYRYYVYPVWSPDGGSIGFVGVSGKGNETSADVYIAPVEEQAKKVFSSASEHPFYLYWSPDNTNLAFLSSTADGQSMILQTVSSESDERTVIDAGSPYYWSWAPDGKTMIVHTGSAQSSAPEHLAFLNVDSGITEDGLDTTPASFQAPAWSADGQRILMTRLNDEKENEIVVTNGRGEFEKTLGTFDLNTAFAWSNHSDMVAYIEGKKTIAAGVLGALHVIDVETSKELFKDDEDVIAFFWSPNDRRLAYFVPRLSAASGSSSGQSDSTAEAQDQQLLLTLKMLNVDTGESNELFTFQPTDQFASILPYFDQYHQSATIWSPDNNNLVLSFIGNDGTPGIAIVAASGQMQPRVMTQGYLAFWSRQ
jgi:Periplasmic component of the Tol biopolymer transport system